MRKSPHFETVSHFWNSETALYNPEQVEIHRDLMCPMCGTCHLGPVEELDVYIMCTDSSALPTSGNRIRGNLVHRCQQQP